MSAEVEAMFSVREVPWHGLGQILDHPPTCREAIVAAGLDWEVETRPLFMQVEKTAANGTYTGYEKASGAFATVRKTDSKVLGVVGPSYRPLQNVQAFDFFDPFVASGEVTLETAGSLKGGRRVWVLGKVKNGTTEVFKNDAVEQYILLANSHDGTLAVRTEAKEDDCKRLVSNIIPLFEKENDDMPSEGKGTMWALYNGVTAYLSHERGRNQDNRVDSLWFGDSAKIGQRAFQMASKMAMVG